MGREVVSKAEITAEPQTVVPEEEDQAGGSRGKPDAYTDRLYKYIPAEVVTAYVAVGGAAAAAPESSRSTLLWIVFIVMLAGTWLYLSRVQKVGKIRQLLISTVGFAVWAFFLGGPFETLGWYEPAYGQVLLPLYTFMVPILEA